jgi:hypothetical protein
VYVCVLVDAIALWLVLQFRKTSVETSESETLTDARFFTRRVSQPPTMPADKITCGLLFRAYLRRYEFVAFKLVGEEARINPNTAVACHHGDPS